MNDGVLKACGMKQTKSRQAVLQVLESAQGPLTAEEIFDQARAFAPVSLTTVYRSLSALCAGGFLMKNLSQDGLAYYQVKGRQHKHYLICTQCGKNIPIDGCPLETLERELSRQTGFSITGHSLELFGLCPACREKTPSSGL